MAPVVTPSPHRFLAGGSRSTHKPQPDVHHKQGSTQQQEPTGPASPQKAKFSAYQIPSAPEQTRPPPPRPSQHHQQQFASEHVAAEASSQFAPTPRFTRTRVAYAEVATQRTQQRGGDGFAAASSLAPLLLAAGSRRVEDVENEISEDEDDEGGSVKAEPIRVDDDDDDDDSDEMLLDGDLSDEDPSQPHPDELATTIEAADDDEGDAGNGTFHGLTQTDHEAGTGRDQAEPASASAAPSWSQNLPYSPKRRRINAPISLAAFDHSDHQKQFSTPSRPPIFHRPTLPASATKDSLSHARSTPSFLRRSGPSTIVDNDDDEEDTSLATAVGPSAIQPRQSHPYSPATRPSFLPPSVSLPSAQALGGTINHTEDSRADDYTAHEDFVPPPPPEIFSPHRRGGTTQKFVPGGLASTVQGWIVQAGQQNQALPRQRQHQGQQRKRRADLGSEAGLELAAQWNDANCGEVLVLAKSVSGWKDVGSFIVVAGSLKAAVKEEEVTNEDEIEEDDKKGEDDDQQGEDVLVLLSVNGRTTKDVSSLRPGEVVTVRRPRWEIELGAAVSGSFQLCGLKKRLVGVDWQVSHTLNVATQ